MIPPNKRSYPVLLSVVAVMKDEASNIGQTIRAVELALKNADLVDRSEMLIVDDGSVDGSADAARRAWPGFVTVVEQENRGRLTSVRRGIDLASGEFVLTLGARNLLDPDALRFWSEERSKNPRMRLWQCDVRFYDSSNVFARFWELLARFGWREYTRNPRRVSFGADGFDRFPKGSGMFIAPKESWLAAFRAFDNRSGRPLPRNLVSDDTSMFRHMVDDGELIWIDPGFSGQYVSNRLTIVPFVRNAFYRGGTFIDSYYPSTGPLGSMVRWLPAVAGFILIALATLAWFHITLAAVVVSIPVVGLPLAVAVFARQSGDSTARSLRVGMVVFPFIAGFGPGLIRGYLARWTR